MRPVVLLALLLVTGSRASFAAHVGAELNLDYWHLDPKDLRTDLNSDSGNPGLTGFSGSLGESPIGGGLALFIEGDDDARMGLSIGADSQGGASSTASAGGGQVTQSLAISDLEMPFTLYAKRFLGDGRWSAWGGLGTTYIAARVKASLSGPGGSASGTFGDDIWAPHLAAGGEFFLTESFALQFGVRLVFRAVLSDFRSNSPAGKVYLFMSPSPGYSPPSVTFATGSGAPAGSRAFEQDFEGPRATLGLRYYFRGGITL